MLITMSEKDIHRFKVLTDVREKRLRQVDAAIILNLSARHIRRLVNQLVSLGAQSLTHAARGRPSLANPLIIRHKNNEVDAHRRL
ncbi:helix-turn-helix domain-containing protein [Vibrio splendidus]